jgi:hypothetical protein
VHLRRALLLFAIVLGLAAIAASVSRPPEESSERTERPSAPPTGADEEAPTVSPGAAAPSGGTLELTFDAGREQTRRLDSGQPATVLVEVDEPGLVEVPELGLSAPADPLTPARFELLVSDPGRVELAFTPAAADASEAAGTLLVGAPGEE